MFNRILMVALLAGVVTGLAATGLQKLWAEPLILEAETYEGAGGAAPAAAPAHEHAPGTPAHDHAPEAAAHVHDEDGWAPADGLERTFWNGVTNVILGVGSALVLAGVFALRRREASPVAGLGWGFAAFVALSAAPAIGLPPELPGMPAAALGDRQVWWIATALLTGGGLAAIVYGGALAWRLGGVALILLPHLVGAPAPDSHATAVPPELAAEFVVASLVTAGAFWIALGGLTGVLARRFALATAGARQPAAA